MNSTECPVCGGLIRGSRSDAVYCSGKCRLTALRQRKAQADGIPVRWPWRIRPDREPGQLHVNPSDPYWQSWDRKYPDIGHSRNHPYPE